MLVRSGVDPRLSGEDDRARVDLVWMDLRVVVSGVDDLADGALVDALLALVRRKRDG